MAFLKDNTDLDNTKVNVRWIFSGKQCAYCRNYYRLCTRIEIISSYIDSAIKNDFYNNCRNFDILRNIY